MKENRRIVMVALRKDRRTWEEAGGRRLNRRGGVSTPVTITPQFETNHRERSQMAIQCRHECDECRRRTEQSRLFQKLSASTKSLKLLFMIRSGGHMVRVELSELRRELDRILTSTF